MARRAWFLGSLVALAGALPALAGCGPGNPPAGASRTRPVAKAEAADELVLGVDLSYVNQVLDRGGTYRDSAGPRSPYAIFADRGANAVRLRLWHTPTWVRTEVYRDPSVPLYSGLEDVARASREARAEGLQVALDIHYSDTWADPGRQNVPAAWRDITDLDVLADSVYRYTRSVLEALSADGLSPDMVQVGNEINCGMLSTGAPPTFPALDVCEDGRWAGQGAVLGAGIRAVRDAAPEARVILHIAQPENVVGWLDRMIAEGGVDDFDIIGVSYYPLWSDQPLDRLSDHVADWRDRYGRAVMVVETAYPWTLEGADDYPNILGPEALVPGFPATPVGQRDYMIALIREVVAGGGSGVFYWEPAWITSGLRDLWGAGSSWENAALFDFDGRAHRGLEFLTFPFGADPEP